MCTEIVCALVQPAMKWHPRLLSHNEFRFAYAWLILNHGFEVGCSFPICWACVKLVTRRLIMRRNWFLLAGHAQYLVTCWLNMSKNWLFAYDDTWKSFWCTTCIFKVFPLFPLSLIPLPPSPVPGKHHMSSVSRLSLVSRPMSPVLRLCRSRNFPLLELFAQFA